MKILNKRIDRRGLIHIIAFVLFLMFVINIDVLTGFLIMHEDNYIDLNLISDVDQYYEFHIKNSYIYDIKDIVTQVSFPKNVIIKNPGNAQVLKTDDRYILQWNIPVIHSSNKEIFYFSADFSGPVNLSAFGRTSKLVRELYQDQEEIQYNLAPQKMEYKPIYFQTEGYLSEITVDLVFSETGTDLIQETVTATGYVIAESNSTEETEIVEEEISEYEPMPEETPNSSEETSNETSELEYIETVENETETFSETTIENTTNEPLINETDSILNETKSILNETDEIREILITNESTEPAIMIGEPTIEMNKTSIEIYTDPDYEWNGNEDFIGTAEVYGNEKREGEFSLTKLRADKYTEHVNIILYSEEGASVRIDSVEMSWMTEILVNSTKTINIKQKIEKTDRIKLKDKNGKDLKIKNIKIGENDIEFELEKHLIKKIKIRGVNLTEGISETIGIDDTLESEDFIEIFAIDPTQANFESAEITLDAKGNKLYKCKQWNFDTGICEGEWIKEMDLSPGKEYILVLTPDDPGFGEKLEGVWWTGTPDFVINETSHFDVGTKQNVETYTNYTNLTQNILQLIKGDIFYETFELDADGTQPPTGWAVDTTYTPTIYDVDNTQANSGSQSVYIYDGSALGFIHYDLASAITHDYFSIWVRTGATTNYVYINSQAETGNYGTGNNAWHLGFQNDGKLKYFDGSWKDTGATYSANTWHHIELKNVDFTAHTYDIWFDGTEYTTDTPFRVNTVDSIQSIQLGVSGVGTTDNAFFDDIRMGDYYSTGNWTSDIQTMTGDYFYNMTINLTADANNYLDKLEILNTTNDILVSNDTNIVSTGTITYYFEDSDVTEDFKVKLYLAGNGTSTPTINDIIGYYETLGEITAFYQCYYSNSTGVNITNGITVLATDDLRCNDTDVTVNGDITVEGNLTFSNFSLTMYNDKDAASNIIVNDKATRLIIDNQTNITSSDLKYGYKFVVNSSQLSMKNSYLSGCGYSDETYKGLLVYTDDSVVLNNTIHDNYYGILFIGSDNSIVENNTFYNNNYSVYVTGSDFVSITNNTIANEDGYGIHVNGYNYNTTVEDNTITFAGTAENDAIHFNKANYNSTIRNNKISFNKNGIFLDDYTQYTTITDNEIHDCTEYSIQIYCRNDHYIIEDNSIYSNGAGIGIIADGTKNCPNNLDISIINNNITGNTESGIRAEYSQFNALNNNITSSTYGITENNAWFDNNFIKNISYNNIFDTIYAIYYSGTGEDSDKDAYLYGNIIDDSDYGIYVDDITRTMHFNDNNLTGSATYDAYIRGAPEIIFTALKINNIISSFTGNNITIKDQPNPPASSLTNGQSFLTITSNGAGAWVYLNLTYNESKASDENRIRLWKHDGSSWSYVSSSVNAINNYVYGNITSFSDFGIFEDTQLTINSITILPDDGDPGTVVNPVEGSNKTVNVTVEFSNNTWIDSCYVRIFNSTATYESPVYGPLLGTIQNCVDENCECFVEWDMEYWRNSGEWNVSANISVESGLTNFTSANFTYNELTAMNINTTTITFNGSAGQTVNSLDAYPMQVKNTGNQLFNLSLNGTDFTGQTYSEQIIDVENAIYNETISGTFKPLTKIYEDVFDDILPVAEKLLYFRGLIPLGYKQQTYQGYIEFKIN